MSPSRAAGALFSASSSGVRIYAALGCLAEVALYPHGFSAADNWRNHLHHWHISAWAEHPPSQAPPSPQPPPATRAPMQQPRAPSPEPRAFNHQKSTFTQVVVSPLLRFHRHRPFHPFPDDPAGTPFARPARLARRLSSFRPRRPDPTRSYLFFDLLTGCAGTASCYCCSCLDLSGSRAFSIPSLRHLHCCTHGPHPCISGRITPDSDLVRRPRPPNNPIERHLASDLRLDSMRRFEDHCDAMTMTMTMTDHTCGV